MSDEVRGHDHAPEQQPPDAQGGPLVSRRAFLTVGAAAGLAAGAAASWQGLLPVTQFGTERRNIPAAAPPGAADAEGEALTFFTLDQAAIVAAATARIIPTDEHGPGAVEAGVLTFIDRQLASGSMGGKVYRLGPYEPGLSTQGDQSLLSMRDRYRTGLAAMDEFAQKQFGRGFVRLTDQEQDQALSAMEAGLADQVVTVVGIENVPVEFAGTGPESLQHASPAGKVYGLQAFFEILRSHTIAGFFSDPIHGGNRDMVGWQLIGFPGAQIGGYRDWILNYGVPFDGRVASLSNYHRRSGLGGQRGHSKHGGGH